MKNKEKLKAHIQSICPLPEDVLLQCTNDYDHFSYPRQTILLHEDVTSLRSYFLESGYMRSFIYDESGADVTIHLFSAPCFVDDFSVVLKGAPFKQYLETITPCEGWSVPFLKAGEYHNRFPEYRDFLRVFILAQVQSREKRLIEMIKDPAKDRYMRLLTSNPDMFQHVPLKIIATYLGITDTSLSRIRREIFLKKPQKQNSIMSNGAFVP